MPPTIGCDRRGPGASRRTAGSRSARAQARALAALPGVRRDPSPAARSRSMLGGTARAGPECEMHGRICVAHAYIGTSGWVYAGWRQHLYADTPVKRWLEVASRAFDALEINGSFYTQIKPETYQRWYDETPPAFRFAL